MRITYDLDVDTLYIHLTDKQLPPGWAVSPRRSFRGVQACIVLA